MIIVDLSVVKHSCIHASVKSNNFNGDYNVFFHTFMGSLISLKNKFKCTSKKRIILACDMKEEYNHNGKLKWGYWRHKVYDENKHLLGDKYDGYKSKRQLDESIDWEKVNEIFYKAIDILKNFTDFQIIKISGVEGDDILAVLSQLSKKPVTLVTIDKDLKTMINEKVKYFNYKTKEYVEEMTESQTDSFFLSGDIGDSIPSAKPGMGKVKWNKYFDTKTLDDAFNEFGDEFKSKYEINKKLMSLKIQDLPNDIVKKIVDEVKISWKNFKKVSLTKAVREFDVESLSNEEKTIKPLIERLDDFRLFEEYEKVETKKNNYVDYEIENKFF